MTRQKITAFNERLGKQAVQKGFPPTRVTKGQRLDDFKLFWMNLDEVESDAKVFDIS